MVRGSQKDKATHTHTRGGFSSIPFGVFVQRDTHDQCASEALLMGGKEVIRHPIEKISALRGVVFFGKRRVRPK